jgi:hypothetical protein
VSQYIIRGYYWGYNDETFYPCGTFIKSRYYSEEDARKAKLQLEREHWEYTDLGETNQFFDTDEQLINKINEFTQEKLGKILFTSDDRRNVFIPRNLNDNDYEKFLEISNLEAYKLTKFDDEPRFMAIWFPKNGSYLLEYDECSTALVYEATIAELQNKFNHLMEYDIEEYLPSLKGALGELSESPSLLKSIIEKSKGIRYNEKKNSIDVKHANANDLFALNEVLNEQIFEIRTLSIDEIMKIEEELGEEFEC